EEIEQLKVLIQKKKAEFESVQLEFVDHKTNGQTQRTVVDKLQDELNDSFPNITIESVQTILMNVNNEIRSLNEKQKGIIIKNKEKPKGKIKKKTEIELIQQEKESTKNKNLKLKQTLDLISKRIQERKEELARTEAITNEIDKQLPENLTDPVAFRHIVEDKENQYKQMIQEWEKLKTSYEKTNELLQKQTTVFEQLQDFEKEMKESYEIQYKKYINA